MEPLPQEEEKWALSKCKQILLKNFNLALFRGELLMAVAPGVAQDPQNHNSPLEAKL